MKAFRTWAQDAAGAVADLGVLAPLAAALVLSNGMDTGTVLVGVGALYLVAGWYFKVPVPVQPIKAAAAIAIAQRLPPETLATAGIILGVVLAVLGATGATVWLTRLFAMPVVRGLQLGLGLILVRTAIDLASREDTLMPLLVAGTVAVALVTGSRLLARSPVALVIVLAAVAYTVAGRDPGPGLQVALWDPRLNPAILEPSVIWQALILLVIPQLPLTLGNAVVAVVDLEHRYYPNQAHKVGARSVSLSCGLANIAAGLLTGMPMCHGSGGLTAHYRAGARTFRMNLLIGGALLVLGLFFAPTTVWLIGLVPVAVLAGFLAFTGLFHASLASSLRGRELAVAVAMGVVGLLTTNLAIALALGMALYWPLELVGRSRIAQRA